MTEDEFFQATRWWWYRRNGEVSPLDIELRTPHRPEDIDDEPICWVP